MAQTEEGQHAKLYRGNYSPRPGDAWTRVVVGERVALNAVRVLVVGTGRVETVVDDWLVPLEDEQ